MKVVVAVDSFKGSMSSREAGNAVKEGVLRVYPDAKVVVRALADGGEGTVEALMEGLGGEKVNITVTGPNNEKIESYYGYIKEKNMAVIETAAVAGLVLVEPDNRNPLTATTYGLGEMIKDAVTRGCRDFILGLGGSATNDGGVGMLQALGYDFLDEDGEQIGKGAAALEKLRKISTEHVLPELAECEFHIACDVTNPLCGERGCSAVFGPQKGATPQMIEKMDQWLGEYAKVTQEVFPKADAQYPGTGAAGGLGFAFLAYTPAVLESGIEIVLKELKLEEDIKEADLVITGEGRLDEQTAMGKVPVGVASLAKKYQKPVIAFSGSVTPGARLCNEKGIDAYFPILRSIVTLDEAMERERAWNNMADTAEQAYRLFQI